VHPGRILAELMKQHAVLRVMMDECERLADDGDPARLAHEVAKLRVAFDAHNQFEEQLLRPVLREIDAFGDVRIERMMVDHVGEHRMVREQLGEGSTRALRDAIDNLRVHLQAEERYFLSSRVLRDDLVIVESGA
jgi:hypothetical protein